MKANEDLLKWIESNKRAAGQKFLSMQSYFNQEVMASRGNWGQGYGLRRKKQKLITMEYVTVVSRANGPILHACVMAAYVVVRPLVDLKSPSADEIADVITLHSLLEWSAGVPKNIEVPKNRSNAMLLMRTIFSAPSFEKISNAINFTEESAADESDEVIVID